MKSKIMKQKETETVFSRRNYIILLIGSVLVFKYQIHVFIL